MPVKKQGTEQNKEFLYAQEKKQKILKEKKQKKTILRAHRISRRKSLNF